MTGRMTGDEFIAKIAEHCDAYRARNCLPDDKTIHVMAPLWAVDLYRDALATTGRDFIVEPYADDVRPIDVFVAAPRDTITLYLHAGFTGPRPGDFDGSLDLGIIR